MECLQNVGDSLLGYFSKANSTKIGNVLFLMIVICNGLSAVAQNSVDQATLSNKSNEDAATRIHHEVPISDEAASKNKFIFIASGCGAAAFIAVAVAIIFVCRCNGDKTMVKGQQSLDDCNPCVSGDSDLAQSAQMFHYQHQKQQILSLEKTQDKKYRKLSDAESECEDGDVDGTVYECPGLASTGALEVRNPMFPQESGSDHANPA